MIIQEELKKLSEQFVIKAVIDLDQWHNHKTYDDSYHWLYDQCRNAYQERYDHTDRIIFTQTQGDIYVKNQNIGLIIRNLQIALNEVDISNCFCVVLSANPTVHQELIYARQLVSDQTEIKGIVINDAVWQPQFVEKHPSGITEMYKYGSVNPLKIALGDLSKKEQHLLADSSVFCIYPWIHLNANPDGRAYPCCMTEHSAPVGNTKTQTLEQIWNDNPMQQIRKDMLADRPIEGCKRCYEQESAGFFSGRQSANKHHGHHISRVLETNEDGTVDRFEMVYWDIRFSNLCNLKCRSCGHLYSSQWYQDQARLAGPIWKAENRALNYAGRTETDMWEQLIPHLDYVEQIYFAGGEPLMMEEHYRILDELERRNRFDVRLIYNTNFTHIKLKDREVFDYWKRFHSVSVGASLDGMGDRGEYIRKGTNWAQVERNRATMMEVCPNVDFYVSSTLSIMNALHLPDFHKAWVEQGFIRPQDLNVNLLLDPRHYRIDIAPADYRREIIEKIQNHLNWLQPLDRLNRATTGFESAINFLTTSDNSQLLSLFWNKTHELDNIRKENILDVIPELSRIQ
jgi:radical SAM protein with 4Fe4S-binding SPASM domain